MMFAQSDQSVRRGLGTDEMNHVLGIPAACPSRARGVYFHPTLHVCMFMRRLCDMGLVLSEKLLVDYSTLRISPFIMI